MKKYLLVLPILFLVLSCNSGDEKNDKTSEDQVTTSATPSDDQKGIGKYTHVELTDPPDEAMSKEGQKVYDLKCASCHRLDETKLVGPGWQGVTKTRKPEWIMNFITNPDENLNKDPQAMALLEECLVRMPNQNLSDADARNVLEFMRKNDHK